MCRSYQIFVLLLCLVFTQTAQGRWSKQQSNTLAWLHDVYFLDESRGFVVGSSGTFLTTSDGGKSWQKSRSFVEDTIRQVYFSDDHNGWLLCERNVFNRGALGSSYVLRTADGGASWETLPFKEIGRERIAKIFFNTKMTGFAVGESGAFFLLRNGENEWKKQASPAKYLLLDGIFTDDLRGTIVGAGGTILFTEDAGAAWHPANVFGDASTKFNAVFFLNQKTGWAAGTNGKIFQTVGGGKTWREQTSGVTKDLTDIFFLDSKEGWAVGDGGIVLHTQTGGNVWTPAETAAGRHKLEKVFFVGKRGWTVGFGGTILVYDEKIEKNIEKTPAPVLLRRV